MKYPSVVAFISFSENNLLNFYELSKKNWSFSQVPNRPLVCLLKQRGRFADAQLLDDEGQRADDRTDVGIGVALIERQPQRAVFRIADFLLIRIRIYLGGPGEGPCQLR